MTRVAGLTEDLVQIQGGWLSSQVMKQTYIKRTEQEQQDTFVLAVRQAVSSSEVQPPLAHSAAQGSAVSSTECASAGTPLRSLSHLLELRQPRSRFA